MEGITLGSYLALVKANYDNASTCNDEDKIEAYLLVFCAFILISLLVRLYKLIFFYK